MDTGIKTYEMSISSFYRTACNADRDSIYSYESLMQTRSSDEKAVRLSVRLSNA